MSLGLVCNICSRKNAMKQRRYTPDEKSEIMLTFIERRKTEGISLRCYAGEIGIPYYTMRDMYRDPRYNPESSAGKRMKSADSSITFVRIC